MPTTIKIYPPSQLPDRGVSETQFSIWCEELEVYLAQEPDFAQFLADGLYSTWQSLETYPNRIANLHNDDVRIANTEAARETKLRSVRTKLRTTLSIIGKCVSEGHYNTVIRHSTSLQWIYNTLRCDYNIQQKGIHFFNILDVSFDPAEDTPVSFYNKYRTIIVNNLSKTGDMIKYKNEPLTRDEKMSPMLEDMILLNVLREIDDRLPTFIRKHYSHKLQHDDKLMDFKSDMLTNVTSFLQQLEANEQNNSMKAATLGSFNQARGFRKSKWNRNQQNKRFYCRMCFLEKMPKEIYSSHNFGDKACKSISNQDKAKLSNGRFFEF